MNRLFYIVTLLLHLVVVAALLFYEFAIVGPNSYLNSLQEGGHVDAEEVGAATKLLHKVSWIRRYSPEPDVWMARLHLWKGEVVGQKNVDVKAVQALYGAAKAKRPTWAVPYSDEARFLIQNGGWSAGGKQYLLHSLLLTPHEYFTLLRYLRIAALYYRVEDQAFRSEVIQRLSYFLSQRYELEIVQHYVDLRLEQVVEAAIDRLDATNPLKAHYVQHLDWKVRERDKGR